MARLNNLLALGLGCVIFAAGCGGSSAEEPGDGGDAGQAGSDGGAGDAGQGDAGPHDGGGDAGSPDGGHDGGTSDGGSDAGTIVKLTSASAHITGRRGRDLRLTIAATDVNKNIAGVMVRLIDGSGHDVLGFDSHQSGVLDSAIGPAAFDTNISGQSSINTAATMTGFAAEWTASPAQIAMVASVGISLRDTEGNESNEIVAAIGAQPIEQNGSSCDPNYVNNRCADTLYCSSASTCQAAPAPQVTQVAYLISDAGPSILIKGTEAADDISNMHVAFEDGGGQPISILLDGDNEPPVSSFDSDAADDSNNGLFFVLIQPALDFEQLCTQIAVTPSDVTGAAPANAVSAKATAIPIRSSGAACDTQGFDMCTAGTVCAETGTSTNYACANLTTAQTAACKAAPVLAPVPGTDAVAFGHTAHAALWNPPAGCSSNNPSGKPVGVASLHLANDTAMLTLSTDNPGTNFDTVLYLLPSCPADSSGALGCNDDGPNGASSVLAVPNVAAGDYTIAVGAFDSAGGSYQLTADVQ